MKEELLELVNYAAGLYCFCIINKSLRYCGKVDSLLVHSQVILLDINPCQAYNTVKL